MKTLFLYETVNEPGRFFELPGDHRHLNGVLINEYQGNETLIKELTSILFDKEGNYLVNFFNEPTKDWDFFARVGFLE